MPSVSPYVKQTWSTGSGGGTPLTAARLNVIEQGLTDAHLQPAVRATMTGSVASAVAPAWATIAFAGANRFDTVGGAASTQHDPVTNNTRLTCRYAGKYQITMSKAQLSGTSVVRYWAARFLLNGATVISQRVQMMSQAYLGMSTLYSLAVNDYVELQMTNEVAAGLTIQGAELMWVRLA